MVNVLKQRIGGVFLLCLLVLLAQGAGVSFGAELLHHWTLDETDTATGAIIADSVGGKNGSVAGAGVTAVEGVVGGALHFDGTANAHVNIPNFGTENLKIMSITFWVNLDEGTMPPVLGAYKRIISGVDQWEVAIQADGTADDGKIGNNFYAAMGKEFFPLCSEPAPEGEWIHVAMTASLSTAGGTGRMETYINGVLDVTSLTQADDNWTGGTVRLAHRPNAAPNQHFQGLLDDIRIYSGILSAQEIADIYYDGLFGPVPIYPAALPDINGANVPVDVTLQWTYSDQADVQVDSYTIYLDANRQLVSEPNLPGEPMLLDGTGNATGILPAGASDPSAAYAYTGLAMDSIYYWRVVANVREPNAVNPEIYDEPAVVYSPIWSFSTVTTGPAVYAGQNVLTWLEAGLASIVPNATVSDETNDLDVVLWSVVEQPLDSTVDISAAGEVNPVITFDTTGVYLLNLWAADLAGNTAEGTVQIVVYADSCQAAKNNPSGYTPLQYDFNNDCRQDMTDLAMFAESWLQDNNLKENLLY
ncbi:MAG: LamG domain-containing protein [Phycisphaerae bacterium]|nr:LamG domain-containing protein [Phycisphaerae bacterium]